MVKLLRRGSRRNVDKDAKQDAKLVERGVHQHERGMHKGKKPTKLKLK